MRTIVPILIAALCLLAIAGTVSAASATNSTGVMTNVWFAKVNKVNNSYAFSFLPFQYLGTNDYGRHTFVTFTKNLTPGDYVILQKTENGTAQIQSLKITKYGKYNPDSVIMTFELTPTELAGPVTPLIWATPVQTPTPSLPVTPAATPTPTKAPVSPATLLTSLCIAGLTVVLWLRR